MSGIGAVLLAAGESNRMGTTNKLSLPICGTSLLRRTAETLLGARLSRIVVVLGHEPETARSLLEGLSLETVYNPCYREGQMTSVHAGLAALTDPLDGVMICLADQPLIDSADIDHLIDAYQSNPDCTVLVPVHNGQRGNPIVLAHTHRQAILRGDRNLGCRRFIERNPELVTPLEVNSNHYVVDLDTPEDYAEFDGAQVHKRPRRTSQPPVTTED